jgi:hypothetical protein
MKSMSAETWEVVYLPKVLQHLKTLAMQAAAAGVTSDYRESLQRIHQCLTNDPVEWGDPQFQYRHLRLLMYHGHEGILHARYGVHQDRPVVFVKEIEFLPGHP